MKALVICPAERSAVPALSESAPLASFPMFGKTLLAHWLECLAARETRQVHVLTSGALEQTAAEIDGGIRWGLIVQLSSETAELSAEAARLKFRLEAPDEIVIAHHLPGMPDRDIFSTYGEFFAALLAWMPSAVQRPRAGLREIQRGIWVGLRTRISRGAVLRAPLWLGEDVQIKKSVVLGPNTIVEDRTVIEAGADVVESFVGPETYVGVASRVFRSFALGNTLINWKKNSVTKIYDPYLLGVLGPTPLERRIAELPVPVAETTPVRVPEPGTVLTKTVKMGGLR